MKKRNKRGKRIFLFFFLLFFLVQGSQFIAHAEVSLPNPSLPNPSLPNPSLPNPTLPNPSLSDSNPGNNNGNVSDSTGNTGGNGKVTTNESEQVTEGREDQGILGWIKDTYTKGKEKLNDWQEKIGDHFTEWVPAVNQMVTDSIDWVKENWEVSATTALGIGLLIGGIFFPPLLVLGTSVLIGEAISGLVGYYWSGLRGKELTQETAIGGLLGLVSGGVLGVGTKLLGIGAKSILTLGGASGVITSVVDDLIRGKKIGLKKALVWGTLSVALAGVPFVGQSIGKYINPAKPAITATETQVGANVVKTSENSVASSLDKNELLRIMQTGEGNLYDLLKRAGVQPSFNSEDVLAAKNVIMQYKPKDIMTGKIPTESNNFGKLKSIGQGEWESSQGLIYGQGSVHGNRVLHVLDHTIPNPDKPLHTVFNVSKMEVLPLIDEAWSLRNSVNPILQNNGNKVFNIPMGRVIGTNDETTVRIVVEGETSKIVTAFPVR